MPPGPGLGQEKANASRGYHGGAGAGRRWLSFPRQGSAFEKEKGRGPWSPDYITNGWGADVTLSRLCKAWNSPSVFVISIILPGEFAGISALGRADQVNRSALVLCLDLERSSRCRGQWLEGDTWVSSTAGPCGTQLEQALSHRHLQKEQGASDQEGWCLTSRQRMDEERHKQWSYFQKKVNRGQGLRGTSYSSSPDEDLE